MKRGMSKDPFPPSNGRCSAGGHWSLVVGHSLLLACAIRALGQAPQPAPQATPPAAQQPAPIVPPQQPPLSPVPGPPASQGPPPSGPLSSDTATISYGEGTIVGSHISARF